jgi:hypothetical protein
VGTTTNSAVTAGRRIIRVPRLTGQNAGCEREPGRGSRNWFGVRQAFRMEFAHRVWILGKTDAVIAMHVEEWKVVIWSMGLPEIGQNRSCGRQTLCNTRCRRHTFTVSALRIDTWQAWVPPRPLWSPRSLQRCIQTWQTRVGCTSYSRVQQRLSR